MIPSYDHGTSISRVVMVLLLCVSPLVSQTVRYTVTEEGPEGDFVGNIVEDSGLLTRYDASVLRQLRYSVLVGPGEDMVLVHARQRLWDVVHRITH